MGLIVAALLAMMFITLWSNRYANARLDRLSGELEPLQRQVERLEVATIALSVEARGYAIDPNSAGRDRYETALLEYIDARQGFTEAAVDAGRADEAASVEAAAEAFALFPERIVDAADRGAADDAGVTVGESVGPLATLRDSTARFKSDVALDAANVRSNLNRNADIELGVTISAAVLAGLAAAMLVGLLATNVRLAQSVERERGRMTDIVESVPGVVWEAWGAPDAARQRIDFVSDHVEEMLGYTVAEWLTTPNFWLTIVHPEDRERAADESSAIFRSGRGGTSQFRWLAKDGRVLEVLAFSTVIRDERGQPAGMRGVTLDITDRVRAERALRFSAEASELLATSLDINATLRSVADLVVPDLADWCAVHVVDDDGTPRQLVVTHNDPRMVQRALELQERYPPDPEARRGVFEVIRTGRPELEPEVAERALLAAAHDEEHLRLIRQVGLRSYICVPMIASGKVVGALTLVSAESGRRYTEADLAIAQDLALRAAVAVENAHLYRDVESERARYASIVASVSHAVIQLDARRRVIDMNPAAESLLGFSRDALAGRSLHQALHPDCGAPIDGECAWSRALCGHRRDSLRADVRRADEAIVEAEIAVSPIEFEGRIVGSVVTMQDVSARAEQERMKDDFIAFASHELRSPLTTLNGMAKWLDRQAREQPQRFSEDVREAIETLSQGADRMAGIVELFLDLTRIESGRFMLEFDDVDLSGLVREEAEHLAVRAPQATVRPHLPERGVAGWSDVNRLRQVLINLLDNAVKYGGDPPTVDVTLTREADAALILVRDNGGGISPADQQHIFERFYRGAQRKKGLGIGLFVSHEIIERLGGSLTFETGSEGTTFLLRLPLTPLSVSGVPTATASHAQR